MGKTSHRVNVDFNPSKKEILQNEDRLELKHKKRFVDESIDDSDNEFKMFGEDEDVEYDILRKYLKK